MKFLGIYREPEYSPGRHTSNDARILQLVGQALERQGESVQLASLDEARGLWPKAELIFSMCQGPRALGELREWKDQGARIINDPAGSLHSYRERLCQTMVERDIPFPESLLLETDTVPPEDRIARFFQTDGAWLKRSDVHAMQKSDVIWVESAKDLPAGLKRFQERGLKRVVLQDHRAGDEVKFYGVLGGRAPQDGRSPTEVCRGFFWPYYPKDGEGYPFDENVLQNLAEKAADAVGLSIFGGDAIISPEGQITLIDVNDWPSFAPCRGAAAMAIAHHLKDLYDTTQNRRETTTVSR